MKRERFDSDFDDIFDSDGDEGEKESPPREDREGETRRRRISPSPEVRQAMNAMVGIE